MEQLTSIKFDNFDKICGADGYLLSKQYQDLKSIYEVYDSVSKGYEINLKFYTDALKDCDKLCLEVNSDIFGHLKEDLFSLEKTGVKIPDEFKNEFNNKNITTELRLKLTSFVDKNIKSLSEKSLKILEIYQKYYDIYDSINELSIKINKGIKDDNKLKEAHNLLVLELEKKVVKGLNDYKKLIEEYVKTFGVNDEESKKMMSLCMSLNNLIETKKENEEIRKTMERKINELNIKINELLSEKSNETKRADTEKFRANNEATRADTAEGNLVKETARADTENSRADNEANRADTEKSRANNEATRADTAENRADTAEKDKEDYRQQAYNNKRYLDEEINRKLNLAEMLDNFIEELDNKDVSIGRLRLLVEDLQSIICKRNLEVKNVWEDLQWLNDENESNLNKVKILRNENKRIGELEEVNKCLLKDFTDYINKSEKLSKEDKDLLTLFIQRVQVLNDIINDIQDKNVQLSQNNEDQINDINRKDSAISEMNSLYKDLITRFSLLENKLYNATSEESFKYTHKLEGDLMDKISCVNKLKDEVKNLSKNESGLKNSKEESEKTIVELNNKIVLIEKDSERQKLLCVLNLMKKNKVIDELNVDLFDSLANIEMLDAENLSLKDDLEEEKIYSNNVSNNLVDSLKNSTAWMMAFKLENDLVRKLEEEKRILEEMSKNKISELEAQNLKDNLESNNRIKNLDRIIRQKVSIIKDNYKKIKTLTFEIEEYKKALKKRKISGNYKKISEEAFEVAGSMFIGRVNQFRLDAEKLDEENKEKQSCIDDGQEKIRILQGENEKLLREKTILEKRKNTLEAIMKQIEDILGCNEKDVLNKVQQLNDENVGLKTNNPALSEKNALLKSKNQNLQETVDVNGLQNDEKSGIINRVNKKFKDFKDLFGEIKGNSLEEKMDSIGVMIKNFMDESLRTKGLLNDERREHNNTKNDRDWWKGQAEYHKGMRIRKLRKRAAFVTI